MEFVILLLKLYFLYIINLECIVVDIHIVMYTFISNILFITPIDVEVEGIKNGL